MSSIAKGTVKTTLTIDGEREYKQKMEQLRNQQQKLNREGKLLSSTYNENTKSVEKLNDNYNTLTRKIENQKEQVRLLEQQLQKAIETKGEDSKEAQKLSKEYDNARIKLNGFEKEIQTLEKELSNHSSKLKARGKAIQEYGDSWKNASKNIENAGKKASALSGLIVAGGVTALDAAMDYESAFTGVKKTVDATEEEYKELYEAILDLSEEIPATAEDIASVAEQAGQLGIAKDNILDFTEVMINLGESTNLSANDAAEKLAKFANVTGMSADNYEQLGSVIVDLGNNFATTEADIVNMSTRLASTGTIVGLSQPEIMALATALSSVGIEAEAGGTAAAKALKILKTQAETDGKLLGDLASVAGVTKKEFKDLVDKDLLSALDLFTKGLNDTERNGKTATAILEDMGIKEVRLSNALLALSTSNGILTKSTETANKAWKDNTALSTEVEKRYATFESKVKILKNTLNKLLIEFGEELLPYAQEGVDVLKDLTHRFGELDDKQKRNIIRIAAIIAAAGPGIIVLGKVTEGAGSLIKVSGKLMEALGKMRAGEAITQLGKLKTVFSQTSTAGATLATETGNVASTFAASGPLCVGLLATTALVAGLVYSYKALTDGTGEVKDTMNDISTDIDDFNNKLENAEGNISAFKEVFDFDDVEADFNRALEDVKNDIQGLIDLSDNASKKIRENKKKQFDESVNNLNEYAQEEVDVYTKSQVYLNDAMRAQGQMTEDELAESHKKIDNFYNDTITSIDKSYDTIFAVIDSAYRETGEIDNKEYKRRIDDLTKWRDNQKVIAEAIKNDNEKELSNHIISSQDSYDSLLQLFVQFNEEENTLEEKYAKARAEQKDGKIGTEIAYFFDRKKLNKDFVNGIKNLNSEELANYIAYVDEMLKNGGELTDEQKLLTKEVLDAYKNLPKGTKKSLKETIDNIEKTLEENDLEQKGKDVGKAIDEGVNKGLKEGNSSIIETIKNNWKTWFKTMKGKEGADVNSPSKKTVPIGESIDEGYIVGFENKAEDVKRAAVKTVNSAIVGANGVKLPTIQLQSQLMTAKASNLAFQSALYPASVTNNYQNSTGQTINNYSSVNLNQAVLSEIRDLLMQANASGVNVTERDVVNAITKMFAKQGRKI